MTFIDQRYIATWAAGILAVLAIAAGTTTAEHPLPQSVPASDPVGSAARYEVQVATTTTLPSDQNPDRLPVTVPPTMATTIDPDCATTGRVVRPWCYTVDANNETQLRTNGQ